MDPQDTGKREGEREEESRRYRVSRGERKDADLSLALGKHALRRIVLPADLSIRSAPHNVGKQAKITL